MTAIAFRVEGKVQGVWYRAFTREAATRLGLVGWVRNEPDGAVSGEAEGEDAALDAFVAELRRGPPRAHVDAVHVRPVPSPGARDFSIRY